MPLKKNISTGTMVHRHKTWGSRFPFVPLKSIILAKLKVRSINSGQIEEKWSTSCLVEKLVVRFALVNHIYIEAELTHVTR